MPISADGRARRAASPPSPSLPPSRLLLKSRPASLDAGCAASSGAGGERPTGGGGGDNEGGHQTQTLLATMVEALGPGFDRQEQVRQTDRCPHECLVVGRSCVARVGTYPATYRLYRAHSSVT